MKPFALFLLLLWSAGSSLAMPTVVPARHTAPPEEYAGTYSFKDKQALSEFIITVKEGALYGEADGNGANKLLPQDQPDVFKSTSQYGSIITFVRDPATKKITGLTLKIMDTELEAVRTE
jgi:hypothetical protein